MHPAFRRAAQLRRGSLSRRYAGDDRQRRDALSASDEPDPLTCRGLDVDASWCQAKGAGQPPADRLAVLAKLGALHHDGAVHVDQLQTMRQNTREHRLEQLDRIGVAIALVAVGEVLADVAEARGTQQRVDHRVGKHVGVGMAVQAELRVISTPPRISGRPSISRWES